MFWKLLQVFLQLFTTVADPYSLDSDPSLTLMRDRNLILILIENRIRIQIQMYVDRYPKQDPQQEMILKWNLLGIRIQINPGLPLIPNKDPDPALILTRIRIQIAFWISASGYIIPEIEKLPDLRWKGSGYGGKMNRYPGWYGSGSGSETLFLTHIYDKCVGSSQIRDGQYKSIFGISHYKFILLKI